MSLCPPQVRWSAVSALSVSLTVDPSPRLHPATPPSSHSHSISVCRRPDPSSPPGYCADRRPDPARVIPASLQSASPFPKVVCLPVYSMNVKHLGRLKVNAGSAAWEEGVSASNEQRFRNRPLLIPLLRMDKFHLTASLGFPRFPCFPQYFLSIMLMQLYPFA